MKKKIDWKLLFLLPVGENEVIIAYAIMIAASTLAMVFGWMSGLVVAMVVFWPVFAFAAVLVSRLTFILWTGRSKK